MKSAQKRRQVLYVRAKRNKWKNIKVNGRKESVMFTNWECKKLQRNFSKTKDLNPKSAVYQKKMIYYYHIFATGNDTKQQHHVEIYKTKSKKLREKKKNNMALTQHRQTTSKN